MQWLPGPGARLALSCGAVTWAGVLLGMAGWPAQTSVAAAVGAIAGGLLRRGPLMVLAALLTAGTISGAGVIARQQAELEARVPDRTASITAVALEDARISDRGPWLRVRPVGLDGEPWAGPTLVASGRDLAPARAGEAWDLRGRVRPWPGLVRGEPVAGRMSVRSAEWLHRPGGVVGVAGELREGVLAPLERRPGAAPALLSGFLVGDTTRLPAADLEALRRSGLTHYVAVSGSNVALFLALWWLVLGPSWRWPRLRAALGLAGLVVFVLVTRWEPSVVRAAVMAGIVLIGRMAGIPVNVWIALGGAVTGALLVSGELAVDLGFSLSVAATIGVVAAARAAPRSWGRVRSALAATAGAQVAVTPLLLATVGTVPLMSPVANLFAAPLVAASTAVGGLGALFGIPVLIDAGIALAGWVLKIAHLAAPWPQMGIGAAPWLAAVAALLLVRAFRPVVAAGAVAVLVAVMGSAGTSPPAVVVLDVGQGDSILVLASDATVLVDGGPDPGLLAGKLADHGVDHIDLVVITHPHADHTSGLQAVFGRIPVGRVWEAAAPHTTPTLRAALAAAEVAGVTVEPPPIGREVSLGSLRLEVLGPVRRYQSPNDQSIVLRAHLDGLTVLLPGDIETYAQDDLGSLGADVLKVPHQGAATSDPRWLEESAGAVSVISVGPNDFGHPSEEVVGTLEAAGSRVMRTDRHGDVVIRPWTNEARP